MMIQRVNGSLAVSRALGDYDYKTVPNLPQNQQLVSPEPDVYVIERNPVGYLVFCCWILERGYCKFCMSLNFLCVRICFIALKYLSQNIYEGEGT